MVRAMEFGAEGVVVGFGDFVNFKVFHFEGSDGDFKCMSDPYAGWAN